MVLMRNKIQVFWMVGLSAIIAALIVLVLSAPAWAQQAPSPRQFDASDECTNPTEIREFRGTDEEIDTPEFTVTGDALRVRYSKLPKTGSDTGLTVRLFEQSGDSAGLEFFPDDVAQGFRDFSGLDSGKHFLRITPDSDVTSYVVAIDNCVSGSGNGGGNGGGNGNGSASSQYSQYAPDVEITNIINIPGKDLPDTGGPPMLGVLFATVAGVSLLTAVVRRRY